MSDPGFVANFADHEGFKGHGGNLKMLSNHLADIGIPEPDDIAN